MLWSIRGLDESISWQGLWENYLIQSPPIQFSIKVKCSPNRLGTLAQDHIKVHLGLHVHCHGGIIWK